MEQDQSIVVWATPIYHRKLKIEEQKDIKKLLDPFITDEVLDKNAFPNEPVPPVTITPDLSGMREHL